MRSRELGQDNAAVEPSVVIGWIEESKKGDIESFRRLYEAYSSRILNFIYRMINSPEEAEDLTQETFVAVYQKLAYLKDNAKFEPWLFRIARNYVYQRYRSRPMVTVSLDVLDDEGQQTSPVADTRKNPDESYQALELGKVVEQVIISLPEKYREVFVLSALRHLSYQDISDIVGRSLASVKTDIHRARLDVRKQVKMYLKA